MGWLKAIAQAIGLADLWSKYFVKKDDQNTGRQLQVSDNRAASIDAAKETRHDEDDVHRLDDGSLDAELRGDKSSGAGR